ncbi:hypothetical protein [Saccharothrix lopnurensis]|uniref:Uncharacterized protein n=1 Tax=Saccharothrix lopnurensis TaxID=1670621 RepID=A0ABW1P6L1_9PSEU
MIVVGIACVVAGLWTLAAVLFGAGVGAGVGLVVLGVALLLVEAMLDEPVRGGAGGRP